MTVSVEWLGAFSRSGHQSYAARTAFKEGRTIVFPECFVAGQRVRRTALIRKRDRREATGQSQICALSASVQA
jgi:hypothetical protein